MESREGGGGPVTNRRVSVKGAAVRPPCGRTWLRPTPQVGHLPAIVLSNLRAWAGGKYAPH
jgi:hypothetical protein